MLIQRKILDTVSKYGLISSLDRILIGVSGGPDSLALLCLLNELKIKLGIKIIVAHFNHGLRGRDSDLDEEFVRNISYKLGLDFYSQKVSNPLLKKIGSSSEENLRKLRYDFLFETARKYKIKKIAVAHTLDDQAETVLMRLIRGTGLYGLISILPKRQIRGFTIIRPLIEISRKEIENYLKKIKVNPRIDKTNFSANYLRNKLRYGLLKELEGINPSVKHALARFAQQAAIDYDYLYSEARPFVKIEKESVKIKLGQFLNLHTALQRMVVRIALEKFIGDLRSFTNKHWEEVCDLAKNRPFGSVVALTRSIYIKKDKGSIIVYGKIPF